MNYNQDPNPSTDYKTHEIRKKPSSVPLWIAGCSTPIIVCVLLVAVGIVDRYFDVGIFQGIGQLLTTRMSPTQSPIPDPTDAPNPPDNQVTETVGNDPKAVSKSDPGTEPAEASGRYGSIARSDLEGHYGWAWNYQSQTAAEDRAIQECAASDCESVLWFRDAFGVLAEADDGSWGTHWGETQSDAEQKAIQNCQKFASKPETCSPVLVLDAVEGEIVRDL